MCGIVACSSEKLSQEIVVSALSNLQYRGYDSFGFAYMTPKGGLGAFTSIDAFDEREICLPESKVLIGHTRWATHGGVSLANSHPMLDNQRRFALVHNGIVDNFVALKDDILAAGCELSSETDTEVVVALMSKALTEAHSRVEALIRVHKQIQGRNTLLFLFDDGELLGIRQGSPLIIGTNRERSSHYIASDVHAFGGEIEQCFPLDNGQIISIIGNCLKTFDSTGHECNTAWQDISLDVSQVGLNGHKYFMAKEILEQWWTIPQQADIDDGLLRQLSKAIGLANTVFTTGAGGAYFTAKQVAWMLKTIACQAAIDVPAYELDGIESLVRPGDILIAFSQSGETADTLHAIDVAKSYGMRILTVTNTPFSSMSRSVDWTFYHGLGIETCVLSTKSASAQLSFGYMLAMGLIGEFKKAKIELNVVSQGLSHQLHSDSFRQYDALAKRLVAAGQVFILGRGAHWASAQIAALNIKEASYVHAEAFSAGELKHGVIALVTQGTPVILFVEKDDTYMPGVASEVSARGAYVVALCADEPVKGAPFDEWYLLPAAGAITSAIIPCQMIAYCAAVTQGLNPDKPRNLAKSVTVQ